MFFSSPSAGSWGSRLWWDLHFFVPVGHQADHQAQLMAPDPEPDPEPTPEVCGGSSSNRALSEFHAAHAEDVLSLKCGRCVDWSL